MRSTVQKHTYRLRLTDDGRGSARDVEFEAPGAEAALGLAQQVCGNRIADLFQDGRRLARIKRSPVGGFWIVS